jgi:WD40 repeat protein
MARIFISHSSLDNEPAARMKAWLASQGFENAFLDRDKTTGIPPGVDWEKTLYREVEQSQAVIIIQTPNWLASKWCFTEFTQARALGKAIFPAIEAPSGDTLISPDIQTLNLLSDREGGLERLKHELVRIALDAQGGFAWDSTRPPFPGLLAFQEEDAAIYFGRDDDIRRLIERLEARRAQGGAKLIALLGSSGSGKSSLLRAGVIPRLKRAGRNWIVVPAMRPRIRPVDELARALATASNPPLDWAELRDHLIERDPARALDNFANDLRVKAGAGEAQILIPIDQAEELFGVADPGEARRFLEILSQALSESLPFLAVMAMRSDFLGQLQSAAALTGRFEEFSLGPMPLARVPQIIEGPARVAGLSADDAFVQQAARDAETQDALPLLAFALRELLDRSPNKSLTLVGYAALGDEKAGVTPLENAVQQAADEVLAEAKPTDDELTGLREAFVPAMVRVNDLGEYVRRPARWDELPAKGQPLLERLANARLLVLRQDGDARVAEVAHEALLRKWPLLKSWLDSARAFLIGKQQLEQDLRDWEQAAETDKAAALLTGLKLSRARRWLIEHPKQLSGRERAFIQASIEHAEAETRRNERTWRTITWGSIGAALVLAVFAAWAYYAQRIATANAVRALESERQASAERKIAIENESRALTGLSQAANLQGHYADAVKLALAAWPRSAADQRPMLSRTIDALGQALAEPIEVSPPLQHESNVSRASFSPVGARLVTVSGNAARVWDAATGAPIGRSLEHDDTVTSAAFSPDGALVVTASSDNTARVWDAATGTPIGNPLQHRYAVTNAAFSPDGKRVVTASYDTARMWDAATGAPLGTPLRHQNTIGSAAFSPDGALVVTASSDHTARVWDATTSAPIGRPLDHKGTVHSAAFSPDGALVVTTSDDRTARMWDSATGAPIGKPLQHEAAVWSASFSPDGGLVVTASHDGTARMWDSATGAPIGKPLQHEAAVSSASFSPDGALVVTTSDDRTARMWDSATGAPIGKPLQHEAAVSSASFSPDGRRVVTVSDDRTARLWAPAIGTPIGKPLQHNAWVNASFSPDGRRVVTVSDDRTARVWDAATGAPIGQPMRHEGSIRSAAFSPDGGRVLTASVDKTAQIWDAATGAPIGQPLQHEDEVSSASFSPDGARVVTTSQNSVRVWDSATGSPNGQPLRYEETIVSAAFSPGIARVVTARSEDSKAVRLWDAEAGAPVGQPLQHEGRVARPVFSSDGKRVVTASDDGTARVWDAATGLPIGRAMQHENRVWNAAFSPDAAKVVTASSDYTARVWDAATGAPIGKALWHEGAVHSAAFSPDGARVLTISEDKTARVWDAATGAPIGLPMEHDGYVMSAAFSSDGAKVVTSTAKMRAQIWRAAPAAPDIVATACKMLGNNHDTAGLFARYGIDIKDPICAGDALAPDPSRMIER